MGPIELNKQAVENDPYLIWNTFVGLLAEHYEELSPEQRPAHLVFVYDSEVENGGHLQYFENRGTQHLEETVEALGTLGCLCQKQVLLEAGELYLSHSRMRFEDIEEFSAALLEGEFSAFDRRFEQCSPSLTECLEAHLSDHQQWFVILN